MNGTKIRTASDGEAVTWLIGRIAARDSDTAPSGAYSPRFLPAIMDWCDNNAVEVAWDRESELWHFDGVSLCVSTSAIDEMLAARYPVS